MGRMKEERFAALVLIWTEEDEAEAVAQAASTKRIVDGDQVISIVRWAAASKEERSDAPDVIAGISATDEDAIASLVEEIRSIPGLRNPNGPQTVNVKSRYVEGWRIPHNGWP